MKDEIRTCENCPYAEKTDIDGLVICTIDNRSKDVEMECAVVKNDSTQTNTQNCVGRALNDDDLIQKGQ